MYKPACEGRFIDAAVLPIRLANIANDQVQHDAACFHLLDEKS